MGPMEKKNFLTSPLGTSKRADKENRGISDMLRADLSGNTILLSAVDEPQTENESTASSSNFTKMLKQVAGLGLGTKGRLTAEPQVDASGRLVDPKDPYRCIMSGNPSIPKEVRYQIYGYLMDHRYTKYACQQKHDKIKSTSVTYRFKLAMMRCNHATRNEIMVFLLDRNQFILVKYTMPGFQIALVCWEVPVISSSGLGECNIHALRVSVKWKEPPNGEHFWDCADRQLLMLREDFPRFFEMLRFECQHVLSQGIYVLTDRAIPLTLIPVKPAKHAVSNGLKIEFYVCDPDLLKEQELETLFNSVRSITGGAYSLSIASAQACDPFASAGYVRDLKHCMSPPVKWVHAILWDQLETAWLLKQLADPYMLAGDYSAARERYIFIWNRHHFEHTMFNEDLCSRFEGNLSITNPNQDAVIRRLRLLHYDVYFSLVAVRMLLKDHGGFNARSALASLSGDRQHFTTKQELQYEQLSLLACLHEDWNARLTGATLRSVQRRIADVESIAAQDTLVAKDIRRIKKYTDRDPRQMTSCHEIFTRRHSKRTYDSESELAGGDRPKGLKYWVDTKYLARLTREEKEKIQLLQQKNHLPVSEF